MKKITRCLFCYLIVLFHETSCKPYVVADLYGQMGNNLFQVAVASSLAWDNDAEAYFPDLAIIPTVYNHIFSRCKSTPPSEKFDFYWGEPGFAYHEIPYHPNMHIRGYFQSEKYFKHNRQKLLELLAPNEKDLRYIKKKYSSILNHPETVGVQIRYYFEDQNGEYFIQYGKDYLDKAMSMFPKHYLFVVSSNNIDFAKANVPSWASNVIYLDEQYYIDFFLLSLCKHNIISNSSFGWWVAWLNQNPNKIVIRPSGWINGLPTQDVCPDEWISIDAKKGCVRDPNSY